MFLQFLLAAISGAATEELKVLLEKFRELNGDVKYNELVEALRNSFELLVDVAKQTHTKADDTLVNLVLNSLPPKV